MLFGAQSRFQHTMRIFWRSNTGDVAGVLVASLLANPVHMAALASHVLSGGAPACRTLQRICTSFKSVRECGYNRFNYIV